MSGREQESPIFFSERISISTEGTRQNKIDCHGQYNNVKEKNDQGQQHKGALEFSTKEKTSSRVLLLD
jgi:hypothetical protein